MEVHTSASSKGGVELSGTCRVTTLIALFEKGSWPGLYTYPGTSQSSRDGCALAQLLNKSETAAANTQRRQRGASLPIGACDRQSLSQMITSRHRCWHCMGCSALRNGSEFRIRTQQAVSRRTRLIYRSQPHSLRTSCTRTSVGFSRAVGTSAPVHRCDRSCSHICLRPCGFRITHVLLPLALMPRG
jgi:hypothetical protein